MPYMNKDETKHAGYDRAVRGPGHHGIVSRQPNKPCLAAETAPQSSRTARPEPRS